MKKITIEQVIVRYAERHLELLGDYVNITTPVLTRYVACGHTATIEPHSVLRKDRIVGCKKCSYTNRNGLKLSQEQVQERFHDRGFELLGLYTRSTESVLTRCLQCQYEWKPQAGNILNGHGCPRCAGSLRITQEEAISRFLEKGLRLITQYITSHDDVEAECTKCGAPWEGKPYHIFNGGGCPDCADYGFNPSKPAILYYVRLLVPDLDLFKIGITNRTVKERFGKEWTKIELVFSQYFTVGEDAYAEEQRILDLYSGHKYSGPKLLAGGNDEIFTSDVLRLYCGKGQILMAI